MLELKAGPRKLVGAAMLVSCVAYACSTSDSGAGVFTPGSGTPGGGSGSGNATGTPARGGGTSVAIDLPSGGNAGQTSEVVACTEGTDCTCPTLNVAVIGKPGKWGAKGGDSDTAFQEWLNSSSAGTAKADVFPTKPTLTPEFLATYNVIILASLSDDSNGGPFWTFDASEVTAFQDWIERLGGGVITLTGYSSDVAETRPTNQLTAFSGVQYNPEDVVSPCLDWAVCGCAGSMTLADFNRTEPSIANVSRDVTWIGFEKGRSITAPTDAWVAATVLYNNEVKNVVVGKAIGTGRVLMYGDEWITYTSQWTGAGVDPNSCTAGNYPQDKYQTAQYWFNMIKWVQPKATCFKIVYNDVPVTIW